jgi:hypothetical protein
MKQKRLTKIEREELERALFLENKLVYLDTYGDLRRIVKHRIAAREQVEARDRRLRGAE